jgi:hypothetical protein
MSLGWRGRGEWRCAALRLGGIRLEGGGGLRGAALRLGGIRVGRGGCEALHCGRVVRWGGGLGASL